jgi:hypothetical protein
MALVIMGHGASAPLLHRQAGLGVRPKGWIWLFSNNSMVGRVNIEADDFPQLGSELRIVGQLELATRLRVLVILACQRYDDCSGVNRQAMKPSREAAMGKPTNVERLLSRGVLKDDICLKDSERASINNMRMPDADIDLLIGIKDQLGLSPLLCEDIQTILVLRRL